MSKRLLIAAAVGVVAAIAGTAFAVTSGHTASAEAPAIVVPAAAPYTISTMKIAITPQAETAQDLTGLTSAVASICGAAHIGVGGCLTAKPDKQTMALFSYGADPKNPIVDQPVILLTWSLKGAACALGLAPKAPASMTADQVAAAEAAESCTYTAAYDASTHAPVDAWEL